jgi:hypothetical protein
MPNALFYVGYLFTYAMAMPKWQTMASIIELLAPMRARFTQLLNPIDPREARWAQPSRSTGSNSTEALDIERMRLKHLQAPSHWLGRAPQGPSSVQHAPLESRDVMRPSTQGSMAWAGGRGGGGPHSPAQKKGALVGGHLPPHSPYSTPGRSKKIQPGQNPTKKKRGLGGWAPSAPLPFFYPRS